MCAHNLYLSKNKKNIKYFELNIIIFTTLKNLCMIHGHVLRNVFYIHVAKQKDLDQQP